MKALAIDTALGACSACIYDGTSQSVLATHTQIMQKGHAEQLVPIIQHILDETGLVIYDISRVCVTTGPGSFTGLRVGLAAARAIRVATNIPCIGVTTLAALAAPLMDKDDRAPVAAAIDARHDNVYFQMMGPGGRTFVTPRLVSVREAVRSGTGSGARLVGSGAPLLAKAWPAFVSPPEVIDPSPHPKIEWVAKLGLAARDEEEVPKPFYLKAADARPQLHKSIARL